MDIGLGTDPLEKQLDPRGPIASRGRSVGVSVYGDKRKKTLSGPLSLTEFSGSAHGRLPFSVKLE